MACTRFNKQPGYGTTQKVAGERALYRDARSGTFFVRVYYQGADTLRSLETTCLKQALERLDARRAAKAAAHLGLTLEWLHQKGLLKKKITSRGMRAFYVLVCRSHGVNDPQIAWEINHVGGVVTLESVYGGVPPHWLQGQGSKLEWRPKGKPAWSQLGRRCSGHKGAAVVAASHKPAVSRGRPRGTGTIFRRRGGG